MKNLGLYIHIPFCVKKCKYCDFLSFEGCEASVQKKYAAALIKEIEGYGAMYGDTYNIDSVFIGGGTPSVLPEAMIGNIMGAVNDAFDVAKDVEVTIESNPGTLTETKLTAYLEAGINRLSMGIQSLNDEMLSSLGRIHTANEAVSNYKVARNAGFKNINTDLMFAIPGHTQDIWEETLQQILELDPAHISFYSLQLEEGTEFFDMYKRGKLDLISDEADRRMYHSALKILKDAGYIHYEISNCAKPGYQCRHNLKYWSFGEYLGMGLGAHSYTEDGLESGGVRYCNVADLNEYINIAAANMRPVEQGSIKRDSLRDAAGIYVFTALRKREGIDLNDFRERFSKEFFEIYTDKKDIVSKYAKDGLIKLDEKQMSLTEAGIDISNKIMAEFV